MIHSCSYYCHKPECIKAQRDELRDKLFKREWVWLTNEEIWDAYMEISAEFDCNVSDLVEFTRAIEAKLKEKNSA